MADLTERAKQAIDEMFRDTTVPQSETRDNLQDIIDHCEIMKESLDEDDA